MQDHPRLFNSNSTPQFSQSQQLQPLHYRGNESNKVLCNTCEAGNCPCFSQSYLVGFLPSPIDSELGSGIRAGANASGSHLHDCTLFPGAAPARTSVTSRGCHGFEPLGLNNAHISPSTLALLGPSPTLLEYLWVVLEADRWILVPVARVQGWR